MSSYLLDTSVIVDCLRGRKERGKLLRELVSRGSSLGCCLVNIVEVYTGMREKEREKTAGLVESLEYYQVTREVARLSGDYRRSFLSQGVTLSLADAIIAAVAVYYDCVLVTDNRRHYPLPDIRFYPLEQ